MPEESTPVTEEAKLLDKLLTVANAENIDSYNKMISQGFRNHGPSFIALLLKELWKIDEIETRNASTLEVIACDCLHDHKDFSPYFTIIMANFLPYCESQEINIDKIKTIFSQLALVFRVCPEARLDMNDCLNQSTTLNQDQKDMLIGLAELATSQTQIKVVEIVEADGPPEAIVLGIDDRLPVVEAKQMDYAAVTKVETQPNHPDDTVEPIKIPTAKPVVSKLTFFTSQTRANTGHDESDHDNRNSNSSSF